ncbi:MAG: peptidylprolyl isomerase [Ralstonia sp.]|jgi:peptidyl-prolyl cis-trans isomerase SurA|uniref:Chaperone SurA n=4 Tax=Pseudomonadota TaxID=1224 RepID=A0ABM9IR22_RALPI|nr:MULTISPECIES: peptidylprolyl isomerase [Ralstonia]MBA4199596.1 molecular chaperone SurA [Ralstonia sp.]MBA4230752.1 molecular chaperone SurA [Ralstonia sp.]MBA4235467.1 molecular chaperone SurA [Ralstonia sp.]MBA4278075.1 molecular chaperone SurA [Ralstonia sp.]MBA4294645.1 molecular chaperone SurA [Ralstonia sp.]
MNNDIMAFQSTAFATRVASLGRLRVATGVLLALLAGTTLSPAVHAQQAQSAKKSAPVRGIFANPGSSPSQPLLQGTLPEPTAPGAPRSQLVDEVVAVVNTDVITRRELLNRADLVERTFRAQNRPLPPRADLLGEVLEQLILERVQAQTAKESGIRVSDADVDRAVESVAQRNNLSVPQLKSKLKDAGMTYDKYRDDLRQEILLARLREREVDSKVQVYDGEIDNYLAQQGGGTAPAGEQQYNVAQILVPVAEGATDAEKAAARKKAEGLLKQAQGGADFAKLARDNSGAQDAAQGGELGLRPIGRLPAVFANAVVDMKAGQVASQVVESPAGYHVIKLLDKRAPGTAIAAKVQQTQVRHILIKTGPTMSADDARRQLVGLRDRIVHGYDFGDAARRYSQDGSAGAGGELGWVSPGQLVPEFEQAMNQLKPGDVSQPVQSQFGVHLIQVEGRREAEVSGDRQRDYARSVIREQKVQAAYEDWLRELRDSAHVEYRVNRQQ